MDIGINDLIRRTKDNIVGKQRNGDISHVILQPQQQFVSIRRDKLSDFWAGYCDLIYKGEGVYSIAEFNERDMPVVTILTFRFNTDNIGQNELYTDRFLNELIHAFQQGIVEKLNLSEMRDELICVVLESHHTWTEGSSTLFQVRLQFPFCRTETGIISKIRERAISILRRRNALKELKVSPESDWDRIIDPHVHLEPLPLYKSVKSALHPKMTLTGIYGEITEDNLMKNLVPIFTTHPFDPQQHIHVSQGLIESSIFEANGNPNKEDPIYWLPMILSTNYSNAIILPRLEADDLPISSTEGIGGFNEESTDLARAQYFLQFLSQDRAVDSFSWRDVGRALYTSSEGSEEGLQVWINFTEQSDHFSEEDCELAWMTFESSSQITYKTIAWFAKQDSPEEYTAWHEKWCEDAFNKALELQHARVAEYIYRLYWLEIACASADKSIWYSFNGTRWNRKQKTIVLTDRINKDVIPRLERIRTCKSRGVETMVSAFEKKPDEHKIKAICELIEKLTNQQFITQIIKAAAVPFHTEYEGFITWADSNPNLMGCADCVIEADEKGITTRPGKPEDYVTMTTGVFLRRHHYNWQHEHVVDVMEWLKKVHADPILLHEFLKETSSWLRGRNIEKRVPIWTGHKNNSKSMVIRAFELAFYQYFGKFPTSILTGRRTQSSSATPELARSKGKHVMIIQETDEDTETFKKGIVKEFSGNDSIFTRGLYEEGGEFLPMFKLAIICNKVPRFIGNDPAIKERVFLIPFLSTWSDEAPDDPEEQHRQRLFKKDPHFEIRLPLLAPALLWILIQYYPKYIEEGIKVPPIVREYTRKYWEEQDYYGQYVDECIQLVYSDDDQTIPDPGVGITHTELFRHFKAWLIDSIPKATLPNSMDARQAFTRILPEFTNKKWVGVRIARDEDVLNI